MKKNVEKVIENTGIILLLIFGLFIVYQVIRKAIGGSWSAENIIISLLIFNLGCVFTIGLSIAIAKDTSFCTV